MAKGRALGFIESVGLASSIAAADAALKAANVELIGRENSNGSGMITVKLSGEVGAINAAISAAKASAEKVAKVWSVDIIPRPGESIGDVMGWNGETVGVGKRSERNDETSAETVAEQPKPQKGKGGRGRKKK
jgi:microcompartment protein CcmL/EutN